MIAGWRSVEHKNSTTCGCKTAGAFAWHNSVASLRMTSACVKFCEGVINLLVTPSSALPFGAMPGYFWLAHWHMRTNVCRQNTSFGMADGANSRSSTKIQKRWCFVPLYYFEPEGPDWEDYQDIEGTELPNDAEALVYAYKIIEELKQDAEIRLTVMLVKNADRKIVFRIAFA
jgi:hypothetical protein